LSLNFDAIEVFNGKRVDQLFGDSGDGSAGKGAIHDWFALLNLGYRFAFTGNSDSHGATAEAGYPRNYVSSVSDLPSSLDPVQLNAAVKEARLMVCGGPYVTVEASPSGSSSPVALVGHDLQLGGAQAVLLSVKVQAPPWIDVSRLHVYRNGVVVKTVEIGPSVNVVRFEDTLSFDVPMDSWFVVQVEGDQDLSPVVPGEKPLSFTNPIWVDRDGGGWIAPGL